MNLPCPRSACVYIWILLVVYHQSPADGSCKLIVRHITHYLGIESNLSPDIKGTWTSSSCEARPGPKFVTRYVQIYPNSKWLARFHHYADYQCTKPTFTLNIKGFYKLGAEAEKLRGATAATFNFTSIALYTHKLEEERNILTVANRTCPGTLTLHSRTSSDKGVYRVSNAAFSRRACRTMFGISEYEFSALKLDTRKKLSSKSDLLYFGEIPTGRVRRKYSPTCYQLPLKRYNAPNCTTCSVIRSANAPVPPVIPKVRPRPVMLDDAWGSNTCESRPGGSFLTRYMEFQYSRSGWKGYYYYFLDPQCKKLKFMLYCKGVFTGSHFNTKVRDGEDYIFTVTEASVTPHTKAFTRQLNSMSRNDECGKDGEWTAGEAQDITQTKGCRLLGISLPHTEYDLLKMVTNEHGERELYTGQRPSDFSSPTSPSTRPTSYQIPMLKCSAFRDEFVPPTMQPTTEPTTRFPKPPDINPILSVPTLKRDGDKTTPKRNGKTSKGTKGQSTNGVVLEKRDGSSAASLRCSPILAVVILVIRLL